MGSDGDGPGRLAGGRDRFPWGPGTARAAYWGTALAAALAAAGAAAGFAAWLVRRDPPDGTVHLLEAVEVWLLAVFSAGAVAVLLGLAVTVGFGRRVTEPEGGGRGDGAAGWTMAVGALLLCIYAAGWAWTR